MGLSASGSSSSGDEEGDFGGAVGRLGAGESAAVLPAGGPDISDGGEDAEGEGTGGSSGTGLGRSALDGPGDGAVDEVMDMDGGSREGSVDGEAIDRGEVEAEGGGGGTLVAALRSEASAVLV